MTKVRKLKDEVTPWTGHLQTQTSDHPLSILTILIKTSEHLLVYHVPFSHSDEKNPAFRLLEDTVFAPAAK